MHTESSGKEYWMSIIKSHCVGSGDMFHIEHGSDNFTILDCCLDDKNKQRILDEIATLSSNKGITRFISTHPDDDHLRGLELLDQRLGLVNFYCVKNKVTKEDVTTSFTRYCELRDDAKKAFYIEKGCARKWMNQDGDGRGSSGINILWPNPQNTFYKDALKCAEEGGSPNNISAVIKYELNDGATVLWMGDLETAFMENIKNELDLPLVDILFAPHHGRDSGKIPDSMLKTMAPRMIVIGEAPSEHLCYYDGYNTLCQNSAGDIVFECENGAVHVFTSNKYKVDFLQNQQRTRTGYYYAGTLVLTARKQVAAA
jgi:beta-lactamase superfamily II metal-dependent hydrolase